MGLLDEIGEVKEPKEQAAVIEASVEDNDMGICDHILLLQHAISKLSTNGGQSGTETDPIYGGR